MTTPRRWWQSTIRVWLTLLYAGAFFVGGAVLIALMYLYLAQVLGHSLTVRETSAVHDALTGELQRARNETLSTMLVASLVLLAVVGVVAAAFGWLLAGRALAPLQQITATARRVADRSLHERIALDGPDDEIKDLADTFDAMLERLDRSFEGQHRFVANASHELRTPLTINRTLIEVALDRADAPEPLRQLGTTLLAVNQHHERLIDGLLTLASSEQRIADPTPVDLTDIARHVAAESQAAAQAANVELRTNLRPAPMRGDPVLLERLTQNLIDNAIRYNLPEDGWVTVTTDTVDANGELTVENSGPPVPPYEVPGLFEPFRRLAGAERLADSVDPSITRGAGLGLSIVRSVAHAHGGDVHATPREDGGLTVRVRMPPASGNWE
ncbi:MAG: HAMP domain-containing sensor histidine kinase [Chloroflexota bacterium]